MSLADAFADAHLNLDTLDIDIDEARARLSVAVEQWEQILQATARVDLDAGRASTELEATVARWEAILSDKLRATVDLDTDGANDDLAAALIAWRAAVNSTLVANVDMDTTLATTHLDAAVAAWRAAASFTAKVKMEIEDEGSLANLALTFAGIKPLLDLPVRFHLDQGSVVAATSEIEALAQLWETSLNLSTRIGPTGENELPDRRQRPGEPAQPRAPGPEPSSEPVIRPRVDPGPAIAESKELNRIIEGLLKIVVPVNLNEADALTGAEALAPLIQNLLKVTSEVDLSGEAGALASAQALAPLLEEALKVVASVDVNDAEAVAKTEAIRTLLNGVLRDLVIKTTIDGDEAAPQAAALRATIEAALSDIPAKVSLDPAKAGIDATAINKLVKGILDITVPVKLDTDRAVEHAADLRELVKNLASVTASLDFDVDGDKAVAQAQAITALVERAADINVPLDVNDKVAIEKTAKLRALLEGMLRDLVMKVEINGGEATAEAAALIKTLQTLVGKLRVDAELQTSGAEAHAVVFRNLLKRIAGTLEVDVDLDTKGAVAHAGLLGAALSATRGVMAGIPTLLTSITTGADSVGSSFKTLLGGASGMSGLFESLSASGGQLASLMGPGGPLSVGPGAMASAASTGAAMFAKLSLAMAAVAALLPLIVGGVAAVASAAGGILTLAAAFATLGIGIAGAAAAAGGLGIALNPDTLQGVKDTLDTIKSGVAAATRDVGQQFAEALKPFVPVLIDIASAASRLAPLFQPVLDSLLGFARMFNGLLNTAEAERFVTQIASSVSAIVDMFSDYLPSYLSLLDEVSGSASAVLDTIHALLEVGLQSSGLWTSIGDLMSSIAGLMKDIAPIALPLVEKLVDTLNAITQSDPFRDIIQGGIEAWTGLLDIINDIGDGIASFGIEGAMATVADAFDRIANSGFGEAIGQMFAMILSEGANVVSMLADFLSSDFFVGMIDWLNTVIPMVQDLFQGFADGVSVGTDGGASILLFFKSLLPLLQVIAQLAPGVGLLLGGIFSLVGTTSTAVISVLVSLGGAIASTLTAALGLIIEVVEKVGWVYEAVTGDSSLKDWAADASDSIWEFERNGREAVYSFVGGLWDVNTAASETGAALDLGVGQSSERASQKAAQFSEVLGAGADALATYAEANGLTAEQVEAAGEAAAAAAEQFQQTIDIVSKLREEAAKPIALNIDFEKAKLDLDGLVGYTAAAVKTITENVQDPISTDAETERLASQVVGADGTALNEATNKKKTVEQYVPAHLETSIADATKDLLANVRRDVENDKFLDNLELSGFGDLADQLREFDGPKLELAIQELGEVGSAAVRSANENIKNAQKELNTSDLNPFSAAIADAQKQAVLMIRQAEIVQELEQGNNNDLAAKFAALDPKDLEAAIQSYEALGPEAIAAMEKQLDDVRDALVEAATRIDPLGEMMKQVQNTPGALAGLAGFETALPEGWGEAAAGQGSSASRKPGKTVSGDEASVLYLFDEEEKRTKNHLGVEEITYEEIAKGTKKRDRKNGDLWEYQGGGKWKMIEAASYEAPSVGGDVGGGDFATFSGLADEAERLSKAQVQRKTADGEFIIDENAKMWHELVAGTRAPADEYQATILKIIESRKGLGEEMEKDDRSVVGQINDALASDPEGAKVAANTFVEGLTTELAAATEAQTEKLNNTGVRMQVLVIDGMNRASDDLAEIALEIGNTVADALRDTVDRNQADLIFAGAALIAYFELGVVTATDVWAGPAAARLVTNFADQLRITAETYQPEMYVRGQQFVKPLVDGITEASDTEAADAAAAFFINVVATLERIADTFAPQLSTIGGSVTAAIAAGMLDPTRAGANGGAPGVGVIERAYLRLLVAQLGFTPQFTQIGSSVTDSIASGINGGIDDVIVAVTSVGDDIAAKLDQESEVVRNAGYGLGSDIGEAIVVGVQVGLFLKLPELITAATNIATIVAGVMRAALEINSPSAVTQSIGEQIVEGLAVGLEAGHDRVVVAATGLASQVSDTLGNIQAPNVAAGADPGRPGAVQRPAFPPGATMGSGDLFAAAQAAVEATSAARFQPAPTPQGTPQEASAAARAGSGAYIHADQLIINGVPGAEQLPERVDEEFWRIGYGESPRRRIAP